MLSIVSQAVCFAYLMKGQDPCEYEKIQQVQYKQEVVEMFIDHIKSKGKFRYALGCHGQKGCNGKYDCSGLIYSFAYDNGLSIRKQNSTSAFNNFKQKSIWEAKRGDLVYFQKLSGPNPNHLAIVATGYDGSSLEIVDALNNFATERTLKLWGHKIYFFPGSSYRIYIIENGYIKQYIEENPQEKIVDVVQGIISGIVI